MAFTTSSLVILPDIASYIWNSSVVSSLNDPLLASQQYNAGTCPFDFHYSCFNKRQINIISIIVNDTKFSHLDHCVTILKASGYLHFFLVNPEFIPASLKRGGGGAVFFSVVEIDISATLNQLIDTTLCSSAALQFAIMSIRGQQQSHHCFPTLDSADQHPLSTVFNQA